MTDETRDYGIVPNPHYGQVARVEPVTDPQREAIRRAIADVAANKTQQPVTVYLTTPQPPVQSQVDWTRVFVTIVMVMGGLVLFSLMMVSCHSQPVIVTPAPNCHFLC